MTFWFPSVKCTAQAKPRKPHQGISSAATQQCDGMCRTAATYEASAWFHSSEFVNFLQMLQYVLMELCQLFIESLADGFSSTSAT